MNDNRSQQPARFPKRVRLRKQSEFDRVFGSNAYAADNVLVVNGNTNGDGVTRIGLSVSRRVGNAVVRNRWKRLIREAFRTQQADLPKGLDLVARPRRGATPELAAIRKSLRSLAERIERRLAKDKR